MISIEKVFYYIPKKRLKVSENLDRFKINTIQAKVYERLYELQEVPCEDHLNIKDFLLKSIEKIFKSSLVNEENIKYLIHVHTANVVTRFGESVVQDIRKQLHLKNSIAFGTSFNNCASAISAIEMSAMLLKNENDFSKAIIVIGEKAFTSSLQVIPNTSIMGDASAAVLLSKSGDENQLIGIEMKTYGEYSKGIWLSKKESQNFERNYVDFLSELIIFSLKKYHLKLENISCIIPHNVNRLSWCNVSKKLKFPIHKIYLENIKKYAHCFGADIFINFSDSIKKKWIQKGDYYLMVTVGLGATFAVAVFRY